MPAEPPTPNRPSYHARDFVALLVLLPPTLLCVHLQSEVTIFGPWLGQLFERYLDAGGDRVVDARPLARWAILAARHCLPGTPDVHRINATLQTIALWGGLFAVYRLAAFYAGRTWGLFAAALAGAYVPWGFLEIGYQVSYPYDLPAFAFSAVGLLCVVRRHFIPLAAVIALGTFNKETTLWLVPAYVLFHWEGRWPPKRLVGETALLCFLFAVSYEIPRLLLPPAGARAALTVDAVVPAGWANGEPLPRFLQNIQVLLLRHRGHAFLNLYWALGLHAPAILFFRALPRGLRRLYLAVPFFLAPMFAFGNLHELRLYNEILPLGAASLAALLSRYFADDATAPRRGFPLDRAESGP